MSTSASPVADKSLLTDRVPPSRPQILLRWTAVLMTGLCVAVVPPPAGITSQAWRLLAIFFATIAGSIFQPIPGAAMVLLGVSATAFTGALPISEALAGYGNPIVWMVLAAFFISRGMVNTGLG